MSDDLTKLTVNLVPRAVAALQAAAETTGDTRTDTVNRALQMYATLCAAADSGYVQLRFRDSTGRWIPVEVNRPRWRFW